MISTDYGLESFDPATGQLLWSYEWKVKGNARIVQPQIVDGSTILFGTGTGYGTRRLSLNYEDGFVVTKVWESNSLKPYYNDFVVHDGYIYGFDGNIFACIDLETGQKKWKRGRFGGGQVLLLAKQNTLLIMAEDGNVVFLETNPSEMVEVKRFKAIEGKTWNHPVIARGRLFVRNGIEMACFRVGEETAIPPESVESGRADQSKIDGL